MIATNDRADWLEARKGYLGGTDIAAIIGQNKYKTPYDVYAEKVLGERSEAGRKAAAGTALEPLVRQWYQEETGTTIHQLREPVFHPVHPMLAANIDGVIEGVCVIEIKTYDFSSSSSWGEANTDQVPIHYWCQAQWYTGIIRLPYCIIVALDRGTMEYQLYRVDHSPVVFTQLVDAALTFWNDHVAIKSPPPLEARDASRIIELYPEAEPTILVATPEQDTAVARLKELTETIKPLEAERKAIRDNLTIQIGQADALETSSGRIKLARVGPCEIAASTRKGYTTLKTPWK